MPTRVLVLEDDEAVANALSGDLRALGAEVLASVSGCAAALELLWTNPPDVVILDTHSGNETCEVVLEECRMQEIPTIIFSALGATELPDFAAGLPSLSKSYQTGQLAIALHSVHREAA